MKVYVITKGDYSDYHICAVTLDKDKAEQLREKFSKGYYNEADIEEYDTEETEEIIKHNLYFADYNERTHEVRVAERDFEYREDCGKVFTMRNGLYAYIFADSKEEALKIASDKFAKYRAEKMGL